jgi:GTP cyclohydrolase I
MHSKDFELGETIRNLMLKHNLESMVSYDVIQNWHEEQKLLAINHKFSEFLRELGINLDNDSVKDTPKRVVKFYINELFYGLDYKNFPKISFDTNDYDYQSPLISSGIQVTSTCEHHFVSIDGFAVVGYIPKNRIVGLSKINRVVDFFAKRPQVQERMTKQIHLALRYILNTDDVAVLINAKHNCIVIRGVKDAGTRNITFELSGKFLEDKILQDAIYRQISNDK